MIRLLIIAATVLCTGLLTTRTPAAPAGAFGGQGRFVRALLVAAMLVPVAYFGAQMLAAPYFPGYSALHTSASDLGSDRSSHPGILNAGAMLTGLLALAGSAGLATGLPRLGVRRPAAFALALCLASAGLAALWAGMHPLPSPRHDPAALAFGMFAAPFAAAWVAWGRAGSVALRLFVTLDATAFLLLIAAMSGVAGISLPPYHGLFQKLLAALSFAPAAAIAGTALRR